MVCFFAPTSSGSLKENKITTEKNSQYGPSYTFFSYWVASIFEHYFAARVLLYNALGQAVWWKLKLEDEESPVSPTASTTLDEAEQDFLISQALYHDLPQCLALVQQSQDAAARNVLKGYSCVSAQGFGTMSMAESSSSLYIAIQHFKKRGMKQELEYSARMVAMIEDRGMVLERMFGLSVVEWGRVLKEGRIAPVQI
jgi:hypothetical protein